MSRQISKEGLNEFNLRYKNKVVTLQQIIDDGAFGGIETSLKRNGTILTDWNIYQDQKTSECETIGVLMLDILPWLKEQPTTIQRNISAILFNTWENRLNKDNILKIYVHNKKDVCTVDSKEYFKFLNLLKGR